MRFHPDAEREYLAAVLYLESERVGYGERFEQEVDAALERAVHFPGSAPRLPGTGDLDARMFPLRVFRYTLVIVFEAGNAVVYAVAHQHRLPTYWRERVK